MKTRYAFATVTLAILAVLRLAPDLLGCGPFPPQAIFVNRFHPDFPLEDFARGNIGILQSGYSRSYLLIAYRYLNGAVLTPQEQNAVLTLWRERLGLGPTEPSDPWQVWLETRNKIEGISHSPQIGIYRVINGTSEHYLNCPEDAFHNAAVTLNERIAKFGAASPEVREWIAGQDEVFANCSGGAVIPPAAPVGTEPLIAADRKYQIASANFYQAKWDAAEQAFDAISTDQASPWKVIAPYLAARALVRKGTVLPGEGQLDRNALTKAESQLNQILSNNSLSSVHPASTRLLHFVEIRLRPQERLRELAKRVLVSNSQDNFQQNVIDYTLLLERLGAESHDEDVSDWILTFQDASAAALNHAVEKYHETHSTAWLVACLSMLQPGNPEQEDFINAAESLKSDSPAFPSAIFYSANLLAKSGKDSEIRRLLDGIMGAQSSHLPISTRNMLMALRNRLSKNLHEFIQFAQRVPSEITTNQDGRELPEDLAQNPKLGAAAHKLMFDADSIQALNERMPLILLSQAAADESLAHNLRREIALAAWVRAVLLDDRGTAAELASLVQSLAPEVKPGLQTYTTAPDDSAKKRAAIFLLLQVPGMRPYVDSGLGRLEPMNIVDSFRDNWWCSLSADKVKTMNRYLMTRQLSDSLKTIYPDGMVPFPQFLRSSERSAAAKQWEKLSSLPPAPNYLASQVIAWSRETPDDPRLPEALYLALRTTRWGCADQETTRLSKQVFEVLHTRYANTTWARKAKYWY